MLSLNALVKFQGGGIVFLTHVTLKISFLNKQCRRGISSWSSLFVKLKYAIQWVQTQMTTIADGMFLTYSLCFVKIRLGIS